MAIASVPAAVFAQEYPAGKPIKLINTSAPGGVGDLSSRATAAGLSQRLGVPVSVDNRPGGAYIIGVDAVVRANPDGYTLLHNHLGGLDIMPAPEKLPYVPDRDLVPVAMVADATQAVVVPTRLNVDSVREFVALAKARPGKLTYASSGHGTVAHFGGELFRLRTGIDLLHVPYKSSTAGVAEAVAGRIDMVVAAYASAVPQLKAGSVRIIAFLGQKRSPVMPDVPTMVELGYPDVLAGSWLGVFAPARTPAAIVRRLARELGEMATSPEYIQQLGRLGLESRVELLEDFARSMKTERALWHAVARDANIKFE